jgi:hypothetical protein
VAVPLHRFEETEICKSPPKQIIACGTRFPDGMKALERYPTAVLILVHPKGIPPITSEFKDSVTVVLPQLDTAKVGSQWKSACKKMGWKILTSKGVGQDIRAAWPRTAMIAMGHHLNE